MDGKEQASNMTTEKGNNIIPEAVSHANAEEDSRVVVEASNTARDSIRYSESDQTSNEVNQEESNKPLDEEELEPEHLRKLYVGGLCETTTKNSLKSHFAQWGEIVDCILPRVSRRSKRIAFVTYKRAYMIDCAQAARPHIIDGQEVTTKRCKQRQDLATAEEKCLADTLFIGRVKDSAQEEDVIEYFGKYGNILKVNIVTAETTGKRTGYAFVKYDDYDPVDKVMLQVPHYLKGKRLDVQKALDKTSQRSGGLQQGNAVASGPPLGSPVTTGPPLGSPVTIGPPLGGAVASGLPLGGPVATGYGSGCLANSITYVDVPGCGLVGFWVPPNSVDNWGAIAWDSVGNNPYFQWWDAPYLTGNGQESNFIPEEELNANPEEREEISSESENEEGSNEVIEEENEPEHLRKLFIGGLRKQTIRATLKSHFSQWGEVVSCAIPRDRVTKKTRFFGVIIYKRAHMIDDAQAARPHVIDGRQVDTKRYIPRKDFNTEVSDTVQTLFLAQLKEHITEEDLLQYFGKYGKILSVSIITDKSTGKTKGFGFVQFNDYDPVDKVILLQRHFVKGQKVVVEKLSPRTSYRRNPEPQQEGATASGYPIGEGVPVFWVNIPVYNTRPCSQLPNFPAYSAANYGHMNE